MDISTATRRLTDHVRVCVRDWQLWRPGDTLLMACSGGLDSVATAAILYELAPSLGHTVVLGHIDHGLQPGAAPLEAVTELSRRLDVDLRVTRLALTPGANLQGRARSARYEALTAIAAETGAARIVTAHHADDQAETFLMRACRGAGLDGLSGVRRRNGQLVRPVLTVTRAQLRAFADERQLRWWEDPTNADQGFTRNRLRSAYMADLEQAIEGAALGLGQSAVQISSAKRGYDYWLRRAIEPLRRQNDAIGVEHAKIPTDADATVVLFQLLAEQAGVPPLSARALRQLVQAARLKRPCNIHRGSAWSSDGIFWLRPHLEDQ